VVLDGQMPANALLAQALAAVRRRLLLSP